MFSATEAFVRLGSLLQAQYKEGGVAIKLDAVESATATARARSGDFDLRLQGYATLTADILVYNLHSTISPDFNRVKDPKLDELLDKGRHSRGDERHKAQIAVQQYILENAVWIPLFSPNRNTVVNNRVADVIAYPNAMDWGLVDAWLKS